MTDRELMQMALRFFDWFYSDDHSVGREDFKATQQALRERLYGKWEPQIERLYKPNGDLISISIKRTPDGPREQIHPRPEWVGLTDVEIVDMLDAELSTQGTEHFGLCQAIEAKLKEKNGG
jgi:hypothetical protein